MGNLFFPQLSSGALAQYPVKRVKSVHTAGYLAEDGTKIMHFDPQGSTLMWQLSYSGLNQSEVGALETLFEACCGQFRGFTFIDPVANLLGPQWLTDPLVQVTGTVFTNTGNVPGAAYQTLASPAGYTYSFSVPGNLSADSSAVLTLAANGPSSQNQVVVALNQPLIVYSGALADAGMGFTIRILLQPGQSIDLSQAQLEAQPVPSPFRQALGGVYVNAHWATDELTFVAQDPGSFAANLSIVTNV
jgi:hypothetical protein